MSQACGAAGDVRDATADDQKVIDAVKGEVESKFGKTFDVYQAVSVRTQVVAGVNYFVKVSVGEGAFIHLRVYQHFSGTNSLNNALDGKSDSDPLEYF
eukprot:CAMPEP_0201484584 /NCGR_PEP_ID=MMETSP0151_2-20130828/8751_1 /ASSEMBLY_ACC=CAM_ASM_000257 /TAXON_ID=200890 /ORGANISM="Paramoeba atlantica, Strain 621/1 / CCAP 1560/9" /LENGTH=97 /DNA_ID=CAMNT_0047868313 /DNA_START=75 /DNA_END=368 /DNA_ORIENTATION=+